MPDSVYKVVEVVGTSTEFLGKGSTHSGGARIQVAAGPARRRGRRAGRRDRKGQGHILPHQAEALLQVRRRRRLTPSDARLLTLIQTIIVQSLVGSTG